MRTITTPPKTARERLAWIARYSQPVIHGQAASIFWIALALVVAVLLIVGLGFIIGQGGAGVFHAQAERLESLASP